MPEPFEPDLDLDTLTRDQIDELAHMPEVAATIKVLDEWVGRTHGVLGGAHQVGLFLDLLAAEGFRVTPIEVRAFADLLPPSTD